MSARIQNGIWKRNIPLGWKQRGEWRTDMFKSALSDPRLCECHFILEGGPTVIVSVVELRRVLEGGPDHYEGSIWGPFNINPIQRTVSGQIVQMQVT